jgi:hypothetical protein
MAVVTVGPRTAALNKLERRLSIFSHVYPLETLDQLAGEQRLVTTLAGQKRQGCPWPIPSERSSVWLLPVTSADVSAPNCTDRPVDL